MSKDCGEGSGGSANLEGCRGSPTRSLVALRGSTGWGQRAQAKDQGTLALASWLRFWL